MSCTLTRISELKGNLPIPTAKRIGDGPTFRSRPVRVSVCGSLVSLPGRSDPLHRRRKRPHRSSATWEPDVVLPLSRRDQAVAGRVPTGGSGLSWIRYVAAPHPVCRHPTGACRGDHSVDRPLRAHQSRTGRPRLGWAYWDELRRSKSKEPTGSSGDEHLGVAPVRPSTDFLPRDGRLAHRLSPPNPKKLFRQVHVARWRLLFGPGDDDTSKGLHRPLSEPQV